MDREPYLPCFAEELFVVNLYGTDEEIERFEILIDNLESPASLIEIVTLMEEIKNRAGKMNWYCCVECHRAERCEINDLRAIKKWERRCCSNCLKYDECTLMWKKNVPYPRVVLPRN
ncbi:hypothetical protein ACFL35_06790 [Candidatus Riflebacteria bacterium]